MFFIVLGHVFLFGKLLDTPNKSMSIIYYFFEFILIVHVNSYVLVSGYYQSKSKFKQKQLLKIINASWFYRVVILLLFSILLFACSSEHNNEFYLRKSNKKLSLLLDSNIKSNTKALFLYKDEEGKEYITFQNQYHNEIYFYNFENHQVEFKVTPELEGSNGVGMFFGYYIQNLDKVLRYILRYLCNCFYLIEFLL